jgi:hypothetical protein
VREGLASHRYPQLTGPREVRLHRLPGPMLLGEEHLLLRPLLRSPLAHSPLQRAQMPRREYEDTTFSGVGANMKSGTRDGLLQRNRVNAASGCCAACGSSSLPRRRRGAQASPTPDDCISNGPDDCISNGPDDCVVMELIALKCY